MADRSNARLNEEIESKIRQWDGTIFGASLKNMYENGTSYGTAEKLVSITLSAEGYIHFTVHDSGMCLSRLKREDAPELEIRKQLSQETGREEN